MKRIVVVIATAWAIALLGPCASALADIGIVPSKIEIFIAPGESLECAATLVNNGEVPIRFDVAPWDFARDAQGQARPLSAADAETFHACGSWLKTSAGDVSVLAPGENRTIKVMVTVPKDAEYGTYCTYLQILGTPTEVEAGATPTVLQMNALFLATVYPPGAEGQRLDQIDELVMAAVLERLDVPTASFGKPVLIQATMRNEGNIHLNLKGYVDILEKGELRERIDIGECTLLPGSDFAISRSWTDTPPFGHFIARFYGDAGLERPFVAEREFWVLSPVFGAVLLATLILVTVMTTYLVRTFSFQRRSRDGGA